VTTKTHSTDDSQYVRITIFSPGSANPAVGWATIRCPFTHEHGVGDAQDSYAYDGHRVRKWNVSCHPYGRATPPCCLFSFPLDP
jgi:hypothetical protein